MKFCKLLLLASMLSMLNGCLFTKVVTVPMRLGGAALSIIPVAGNSAHDAIDETAEIIDEVPI
ncbi:MAG: hypothetical protein B6I36_02515 [Desulfobacteraceae bacterium 4572_35.1]|nr:MAG: hypothetical protein B6I36_02515 [Desulfobacteraceae bacterium 4572_35.1]